MQIISHSHCPLHHSPNSFSSGSMVAVAALRGIDDTTMYVGFDLVDRCRPTLQPSFGKVSSAEDVTLDHNAR